MLLSDKRVIKTDESNWPYKDRFKEIVDIPCPRISNYSEYKMAQETEYCFIQETNMYVWEPSELEKLENLDNNKEEFVYSEVYTAFKQTFRGKFAFQSIISQFQPSFLQSQLPLLQFFDSRQ